MDKPLLTRVVLVCVVVALYLIVSQLGWYPTLAGPVAVVLVAVIMFWPRRTGEDKGPSRSEMLKEIRGEQ